MEKKNGTWGKRLYWFIFAVAVIVVYKTLDNFSEITNWFKQLFSILMPFIMGVFVAYILYLPCKKVEKALQKIKNKWIKKSSRTLSILIVYVVAILIIAILIQFVVPTVSKNVGDLINNLPNYYKSAKDSLENMPEDSIWNKINAKEIIEKIQNINIAQYIDENKIVEYIKGVFSAANTIFDVFVTFIISIYVLAERNQILNFIKKACKALFKEKTYDNIAMYFKRTNAVFFKFLSGQLLDAVVIGFLTSIAMLILGVKYAVLLGVLIGISNLIPYLGAIVGVSTSVIITIFTGGVPKAIWLAIIVIILQQIDANIINPKILGDKLKISPILVIFSVTIAGAYFGILGMFLAVPIATIIKLAVEDYLEYKTLTSSK